MATDKPIYTKESFASGTRTEGLDDPWNLQESEVQPMVEEMMESNARINYVPDNSGLYGTDVPEKRVIYKRAINERVIRKKNAWITLGTDKPGDITDGLGRAGAQGANRIDIVVGRLASVNEGKGPRNRIRTGNNFIADAARIYICESTNIDEHFGIVDGRVPATTTDGHSGIAVKADIVRVIGREGIKIVTGQAKGTSETNSHGGKLYAAPPIELIAGNSNEPLEYLNPNTGQKELVRYLQPVALGDNTRDCIVELSAMIDNIWAALDNFLKTQMVYNSLIAAAAGPTAAVPGLAMWASVSAKGSADVLGNIAKSMSPLWNTRVSKLMWEQYYLMPYGYKNICSRHVFAT